MFFLREKYENYLKTNFRKKKDCIFMHKKIFFWNKMIFYAVKSRKILNFGHLKKMVKWPQES